MRGHLNEMSHRELTEHAIKMEDGNMQLAQELAKLRVQNEAKQQRIDGLIIVIKEIEFHASISPGCKRRREAIQEIRELAEAATQGKVGTLEQKSNVEPF